jgi:hypothetical protein
MAGKAIGSFVFTAATSRPPDPGTGDATGDKATWGEAGEISSIETEEDPP